MFLTQFLFHCCSIVLFFIIYSHRFFLPVMSVPIKKNKSKNKAPSTPWVFYLFAALLPAFFNVSLWTVALLRNSSNGWVSAVAESLRNSSSGNSVPNSVDGMALGAKVDPESIRALFDAMTTSTTVVVPQSPPLGPFVFGRGNRSITTPPITNICLQIDCLVGPPSFVGFCCCGCV